ncbi:hypothetical protein [Paenibacillus sp. Y412MC10]|uniref:hypothetical protein n=1 Tax=Geobacillus sp. (strain Y412MC10) TaxID=481743 RepID=UPI0011AB3FB3|nr:hypothetical protein [Paenibacillus sp. Y412MC10]
MLRWLKKRKDNDLVIGWKNGKKPIVLKEYMRFKHEAVFGPAGAGKSSRHQLRRIKHDLSCLSRGENRSLVVIENHNTLVKGAKQFMTDVGTNPEIVNILDVDDDEDDNSSFGWNPLLEENCYEFFPQALVSAIPDLEPAQCPFIESTCMWMVRLAKAFYGGNVNLLTLVNLYKDPRHVADIVNLMKSLEKVDSNPENAAIIEHMNTFVLRYIEYEEILEQFPIMYRESDKYEGLKVVEWRNKELIEPVIKMMESILQDQTLTRILNSSSSLKVSEVVKKNRIVFLRTGLSANGTLLGNLFISALSYSISHRPNELQHPCFITIDNAGSFDLNPLRPILDNGRTLRTSVSLSFQSIRRDVLPIESIYVFFFMILS